MSSAFADYWRIVTTTFASISLSKAVLFVTTLIFFERSQENIFFTICFPEIKLTLIPKIFADTSRNVYQFHVTQLARNAIKCTHTVISKILPILLIGTIMYHKYLKVG